MMQLDGEFGSAVSAGEVQEEDAPNTVRFAESSDDPSEHSA